MLCTCGSCDDTELHPIPPSSSGSPPSSPPPPSPPSPLILRPQDMLTMLQTDTDTVFPSLSTIYYCPAIQFVLEFNNKLQNVFSFDALVND